MGEVITVNYPLNFAAKCDNLESGFLRTASNHGYGRINLLEETFRASEDAVLLSLLSVDPEGLLQVTDSGSLKKTLWVEMSDAQERQQIFRHSKSRKMSNSF